MEMTLPVKPHTMYNRFYVERDPMKRGCVSYKLDTDTVIVIYQSVSPSRNMEELVRDRIDLVKTRRNDVRWGGWLRNLLGDLKYLVEEEESPLSIDLMMEICQTFNELCETPYFIHELFRVCYGIEL